MDSDLQAAIEASLADQGDSAADDDVVFLSEDVFTVEFTDTDGDRIMFLLVDGEVQQYLNGNLEIARVKEMAIDESSGQVADAKGRFAVPLEQRSKLSSLKSLLRKAAVEVKPFSSDNFNRVNGGSSAPLHVYPRQAQSAAFAGEGDDDAAMEAALQASIADTQQQNRALVLDSHQERIKAGVLLRQHNTLNQFHAFFAKAITRYDAPNSICGYLTIANCRLLRHFLQGARNPLPSSVLQAAGRQLVASRDVVRTETERAMASIAAKRKRYMDAHSREFSSAAERRKYLRAWVANFEISDELNESGVAYAACAPSAEGGREGGREGALPSLHFARYNEYPQLPVATHEERQRILSDQKRFGGRLNAKGESVFAAGDYAHILERFFDSDASSQLRSPPEWKAMEAGDGDCPKVFAVDLNGHFAAAVLARVCESEGGPAHELLQLYNTTNSSYLEWPMLSDVHGFVFGTKLR